MRRCGTIARAADCLSELPSQSLEQGYTPGDLVVVTLGGGHYAPRANRFGTHVEIGHMLANHSLRFGEDPEDGTWKQAVDARSSKPPVRPIPMLVSWCTWNGNHSKVLNGDASSSIYAPQMCRLFEARIC